MSSIFNILMYSHDTYGLGHIRRTMAIASHLRDEHVNILILTGSPIVGRFALPEQIDFVRIPGMIKMTNEEYRPLSIKIHPEHALEIRKSIIKATVETFRPNLFIVDKEPLGLRKEVLPTLEWLKMNLKDTRTILGLRDIMDEASVTRRDWEDKGVYDCMADLYDEIWVYGIRSFYDPIKEYDIPENVARKMTFTGYISRNVPNKKAIRKIKRKISPKNGRKLVVITAGGGGDGFEMMHAFLSMLESPPGPVSFNSVLVTGPFMPKNEREEITERAKQLGLRTWHFHHRMEEILAAADLVVSMGGYNTVCEILSQCTASLLIPRETPRLEQLIRAKVFQRRNMVEYIPWGKLQTHLLFDRINTMLENPEPYQEAISNFRLTGLKVMSQRLDAFRSLNVDAAL
jgi:predicted glycosyltransferase